MKDINRILFRTIGILAWTVFTIAFGVEFASLNCAAQGQSEPNLVPTDPSINQIDWAQDINGTQISTNGCALVSLNLNELIDGIGSDNSKLVKCTISNGHYVELDLGVERQFSIFSLHLYDGDDRYFRYKVEVSDDGSQFEILEDKTSGEHRGVQYFQYEQPKSARFIRITGTHSSSDNFFYLSDEIFAIGSVAGSPVAPQTIEIDGIQNAGTTYSVGKKIKLNAGIYKVSHKIGAISSWSSDSSNNGKAWTPRLNAYVPINNKHYKFHDIHLTLSYYASEAEASQSAQGTFFTIYLPAEAEVYFWYNESSPNDNRGKHSILIEQLSGPNDSLLTRVRDAMTRSVQWQQNAVANWPSWVGTSNYNCFGCHIQSQASVGLNDSKNKLPDLPVDDVLTDYSVDAYKGWQNAAGWVSPFHGGSLAVTQTSLWAWGVSSFEGEAYTKLSTQQLKALNYLLGVQNGNGGWYADHNDGNGSKVYFDGSPSAAHTAGNILALSRAVTELGSGDFVSYPDVTISGSEIEFSKNPGYQFGVKLSKVLDATAFRIVITDTFQSGKNFVLNELEILNGDNLISVASSIANHAQSGYPIAESHNGIKTDINDGWAYSGQNPTVTPADGLYIFANPSDIDQLQVTQIYPDHQLKKVRFEYTLDPAPSASSNFLPVSVSAVGTFVTGPGDLKGKFIASIKKAADLLVSSSWDYKRNTRTAAQTIIGLHAALSYLDPSAAQGAITRIGEVALYLRGIQHEEGGWGDGANGTGSIRVYPSAQALRALLLVSDSQLDDGIVQGAQYLLNTQDSGGAWISSPLATKLAVTTWVEIALPTLFEFLSDVFTNDNIATLLAVGLVNSAELSWAPIDNATGYNIYRRTESSSWQKIKSSYKDNSIVTYLDEGLASGVPYYYKVTWLNSQGIESTESNEASATPTSLTCENDSAPIITSAPVVGATQDKLYQYLVESYDPDEGDILGYSLGAKPTGMSINSDTGLISWTPTAQDAGYHLVQVRVEDPVGHFAVQSYQLKVSPIYFNYPPKIVSAAPLEATVGYQYVYDADAHDPNIGDILTFSLIQAPQGASINLTIGKIKWTPSQSEVGSHAFKLQVSDAAGASDTQEFTVEVETNAPPSITSEPLLSAPKDIVYGYKVEASDPEGGVLKYKLLESPGTMKINSKSGLITWLPSASDIGSHSVVVEASDSGGLTATQPFELVVPENSPPYFVSLGKINAAVGAQYIYKAVAIDPEGGNVSFSLAQAPSSMAIDSNYGVVSWVPTLQDQPSQSVTIRATDIVGLTAEQSFVITVADGDPGGSVGGAVNVSISSPEVGSTISTPTKVVGTISGESTISWLAYLKREGDDSQYEIGSGSGPVNEGEIGEIDPTILENDSYLLWVDVDNGTSVKSFFFGYTLYTPLKLGNFKYAVTDLVIPVSGVPISVVREINSIDTSKSEFGHGWRLKYPGKVVDAAAEGEPAWVGMKVFVTRPDGERVGFTFLPFQASFLLPFYTPYFKPDPGVTDKLEVDNNVLFNSGGFIYELFGVYNPSRYYLTTKDNLRYTIDEGAGIKEIKDPNQNTLTFLPGSIVHSSGELISLVKDSENRITKIIDPAGKEIKYDYTAQGDLLSVTNQNGDITKYSYDQEHRLLTITDPSNTVVLTNVYDTQGHLIKQIDAFGKETLINVSIDDLSETITDRLGNPTTYKYDTNGNLVEKIDALGGKVSYSYDGNYNLTSATDALGRVKTFQYDSLSNLLKVTNSLGESLEFTYNNLSQVTSIKNHSGAVSKVSYDPKGNITKLEDFSGRKIELTNSPSGEITSIIDGSGNTVFLTYDAKGQVVAITNALGASITFEYDEKGNLTSKCYSRTDNDSLVHNYCEVYEYDELGRVVKFTDGEGNFVEVSWNQYNKPLSFKDKRGNVATFDYNSIGLLTQINYADATSTKLGYDSEYNQTTETDRLGRTTTYLYDDLYRKIGVQYPDQSSKSYKYDSLSNLIEEIDELGRITTHSYDELNRKISTTNPLGGITQTLYDLNGNISQYINPNGQKTEYLYDADGRVLSTVYEDGSSINYTYNSGGKLVSMMDQLGFETKYEYDQAGRKIKSIDPLGNTVQYGYDGVGNLLKTVDEDGNITLQDYDNVGLQIRRALPLGMKEYFEYDPNGNLTKHTDYNLRERSYQYDSNDRVIKAINHNSGVIQYLLDSEGNLKELIDPLLNKTTFSYDPRNRKLSMTDPLGLITSYAYDLIGNLKEIVDRNGRKRIYHYDELNRILSEEWYNGLVQVNEKNFKYDAVGNILEEEDESSSYKYQYDLLNRTTNVEGQIPTVSSPVTISKSYDLIGREIEVSSGGLSVSSQYDPRGFLKSKSWGNREVKLERGSVGQLSQINRLIQGATVASTQISSDQNIREKSRTHKLNDGTVISDYSYDYNAGGELTVESHHGNTATYGYNQTGEVVSTNNTAKASESFSYDLNGNRTIAGYQTVAPNQYTTDGIYQYQYDGEGNVVKRIRVSDSETTTYSYDHENKLASVVRADSGGTILSTIEFTYDVRGRRVGKSVNGLMSVTLYDGEQPVSSLNSQGDSEVSYLYGEGIDEILARDSQAGVEFYLSDRLGTVHDRIDSSGTVVNSVDYSTFGIPISESGVPDPFKFTGREYDPETGLYYYRARYYDPVLGRFLSQDPLGFDGGDTNLYRYVANAPMNGTDPLGTTMVEYQVNISKGPTAGILASQNAVPVLKTIEAGIAANIEAATTLQQAASIARSASFFKVTAESSYFTLGVTNAINAIFVVTYGTFKLFSGDEDLQVVETADSITTSFSEQIGEALEVEGVKKEQKQKKCDPKDETTWKYLPNKLNEHTEPMCRALGKSCFFSKSDAIALSKETLLAHGAPVGVTVITKFNRKTGYIEHKKTHTSVSCYEVAAVLRGGGGKHCYYHGYPTGKRCATIHSSN